MTFVDIPTQPYPLCVEFIRVNGQIVMCLSQVLDLDALESRNGFQPESVCWTEYDG